MLKISKISLTVLLIFSISNSITFAATSGSSCTKLGAVSTSKEKGKTTKLTCTKIGNKKLWKTAPANSSSNTTSSGSENAIGNTQISGSGAKTNNIDSCRLKDSRKIPGGSSPLLDTDYVIPYSEGVAYGDLQTDKARGIVYMNPHLVPGFPLHRGMFPSLGTNKIAVLAVDYLDAPATGNELDLARSMAGEVDKWLSDQSSGLLKFDYRFGDRIFRVNTDSKSYGLYKSEGNSAPDLVRDIVAAADPYFDFTGIQTLWVINPKSVGSVSIPGYVLGSIPEDFNFPGNPSDPVGQSAVMTNEGPIYRWTGNGAYQYRTDANFWTFFAHETMHYIGLQDYRYRTQRVQEDGSKTLYDDVTKNLPMSDWEIMSAQDGGSRSLNSFNRLLLGWWDQKQIHCQTLYSGATISTSLKALSDTGSGQKSIMIPLDQYRLLVVESRRATGFDQRIGAIAVGVNKGNGMERAYMTDVGTSGLIAYVHDVRKQQHESPANLLIPNDGRYRKVGFVTCVICTWGDRSNPLQVWDPADLRGPQVVVSYDPLIRQGERIEIEGYTIKNIKSDKSGDYVEITRT